MIKRLWRARQRPRPDTWLLLRPGDARPWQWQRWHDGALSEQADWPPPAGWQALRCALLIPADATSYFEISAPPGVRPSEWPLLLEDRLLQAPEAVLIGCVGRPGSVLQLVALERARLTRWQQHAETLGLHLERYWSEFQLCPPQPAGHSLAWRVPGYVCQVQADERGAQHWLALPETLAMALRAPSSDAILPAAPGPAGALAHLPSLVQAPRPRHAAAAPAWRTPRRLAALCLGLVLLWAALLAGTTWQQGAQARALVTEQLGAPLSLAQAESRLRRAQRDEQLWQLRQQQVATWTSTLSGWLREHPEWALQALGCAGAQCFVTLSGSAELADEARWQALGQAIGARVKLTREGEHLTAQVDLDGGEA